MTSRRARSGRSGRPTEQPPLELRRPRFVEPPRGHPEQLLAVLRALFRDWFEERLAFSAEASIDPSAVDAERAR